MILMVHINNRNGVTILRGYRDPTHLVSISWASSHFVVLYFDIAYCTVTVFDGLSMRITNWEKGIVMILQNYGFVPKDCKHHRHASDVFDEQQARVMKMTLLFEGSGANNAVESD